MLGRHSHVDVHNAWLNDTPITLLVVFGDHFDNLTFNVLYVVGGEGLDGDLVVLEQSVEDFIAIPIEGIKEAPTWLRKLLGRILEDVPADKRSPPTVSFH